MAEENSPGAIRGARLACEADGEQGDIVWYGLMVGQRSMSSRAVTPSDLASNTTERITQPGRATACSLVHHRPRKRGTLHGSAYYLLLTTYYAPMFEQGSLQP